MRAGVLRWLSLIVLAGVALAGCARDDCALDPCGDTLSLSFSRPHFEPGSWSFAIDAGGNPFTCSVEVASADTASVGDCATYHPDAGGGPSIFVGEWQGVDRITVVVSHDGQVLETVNLEPRYVWTEDGCDHCLQMPVEVRL